MMAPLYDEEGNITHLIPSGLDLTPRKEAEDALRQSENFANAILNLFRRTLPLLIKKAISLLLMPPGRNLRNQMIRRSFIHRSRSKLSDRLQETLTRKMMPLMLLKI